MKNAKQLDKEGKKKKSKPESPELSAVICFW